MENEATIESILRIVREIYGRDEPEDVPDQSAPPMPEEIERAIRE
jgi:hypothetical protein